jgi:hypothetical protein
MNWPEAFALVGGLLVFFGFIGYALSLDRREGDGHAKPAKDNYIWRTPK